MKRRLLASFLMVLLLLSLTACGGSARNEAAMDDVASEMATTESVADMDYGGGVEYQEAESESGAALGQKLIRTARLEMETTEFDAATEALTELTEQFQGYFENSTVGKRGSSYRWAEYTIRIPAEKYQSFLNQAGQLCHETWRNTSQQDITESYYDTEGRLKTQQIKLERLQALLARAEAMEDIITIESAISETEWQIEELSGTLRHYDALVDYATVNLYLEEVYKLSNVEEVPDSFVSRMGAAFGDGWRSFVDGMENLIVALAYGWVWVIVLAVIVVVVVRVVRRCRLLKLMLPKKKADDKQDEI